VTDRDILLVEDSPNDVELTLRALKRHNLADHVFVVRDGAEALDFMFATGVYADRAGLAKPRLVLLDLKLPKVDGIEVLRRFKADESSRRVPIVMLTSSAEERDITKTYDLGVNSYIVKPVAFENFAQAIVEVGLYWFGLNRAPYDP
jgi:two-component system response regulator